MKYFYHITVIFMMFLSIIACEDDSGATEPENNSPKIEKSKKRGISYNLTDELDFEALKSGISWWYNWYFKTDAPDEYYDNYEMEFIPMLWGHNTESDFIEVKNFILDHPEIEYLLVLNEPNLVDQANLFPSQAVSEWIKYEQLVTDLAAQNRTVYLVGPAMNWGTMPNYGDPIVWLDAFYSEYNVATNGNEPKIDYLAFHWYDYGLEDQLNRLAKYGKQIWITEMANWNSQINSYEKQKQQMTEMVALCESRPDVFRYAWFIGRGNFSGKYTYLFNADPGDLNDLGEHYLSLPYSNN